MFSSTSSIFVLQAEKLIYISALPNSGLAFPRSRYSYLRAVGVIWVPGRRSQQTAS